jgi:hypothetical protein
MQAIMNASLIVDGKFQRAFLYFQSPAIHGQRRNNELHISPRRAASRGARTHQQPNAAAAFGRQLPTAKHFVIQSIRPTQHGIDRRACQRLRYDPARLVWLHNDQPLKIDAHTRCRWRIESPRRIDHRDRSGRANRRTRKRYSQRCCRTK